MIQLKRFEYDYEKDKNVKVIPYLWNLFENRFPNR